MNSTDVTRIATAAARELSPRLRVVGVTSGSGDGDYAEVLVDIAECPRESCRLSLGVFRNTSETRLHDEIARKLRRRL